MPRPQRSREALLHCITGSLVAASDWCDAVPKARVPLSIEIFDRSGHLIHYREEARTIRFL